jgi:hypothetical protein
MCGKINKKNTTIEKIGILKESPKWQSRKYCRLGLIEPVHERYCETNIVRTLCLFSCNYIDNYIHLIGLIYFIQNVSDFKF